MTADTDILSMVLKGKHLYKMLGLRFFTMLCNNVQYRRMDQDLNPGQLYNVHNKIKICTKHWLGLLILYDI
jgi:hypothetical protein